VTAVRWLDERTVVGALATIGVVQWDLPFGRAVAAEVGAAPIDAVVVDSAVVIVDAAGRVSSTDIAGGVRRTVDLADPGTVSGLDAQMDRVVVSSYGPDGGRLDIVDFATSASTRFRLPDCTPTGLTLDEAAKVVIIGCIEYAVVRVDLESGTMNRTGLEIQVFSVATMGGQILMGDPYGEVQAADLSDLARARTAYTNDCGATIKRIAADTTTGLVFTADDGAGVFGCALRGSFADGSWSTAGVPTAADGARASDSVAVSRTGELVAFGLADGRVRVLTAAGGTTVLNVRASPSAVRALDFTTDSSSVVVAQEDGSITLHALPFNAEADSERIIEIAQERLNVAVALRLYSRQHE
jgi:hypothetical protein